MSNKSFTTSLLLLILALSVISVVFFRPVPVVVKSNLELLPMELGGYTATEDSFSEAVYQELNADKHIYRHYRTPKGDQIDLYIGYYGTAKGGRTGHNPNACLPGAGWAVVDSRMLKLPQIYQSNSSEVNFAHARKEGINSIMIYWYQTASTTVISTGLGQNIEKFWNRLLRNRNDGAFIRISTQSPDNEIGSSIRELERFSVLLLQIIPAYWPEEK